MHKQAFLAANSETGLLIPTKDCSKLIGLNFDLPETLPQLDNSLKQSVYAKRVEQEANLRKELAKKYPKFVNLSIEWYTVKAVASPETSNTRPVTINMAGQEFTTQAHVFNDPKAKSFNIHFPVNIDLSTLPNAADLDFANAIAIDPQQYSRNHGLYTAQEAKELDTIPAPTDYFQTLDQG